MTLRRLDELQRRRSVLGFCYAVICKYLDDGGFREAALMLVIAAEIAAVRHGRLWPRSLDPRRPTPADARAMLLLAREQERLPAAAIIYVLRDPPAGADCGVEAGVKPPRGR